MKRIILAVLFAVLAISTAHAQSKNVVLDNIRSALQGSGQGQISGDQLVTILQGVVNSAPSNSIPYVYNFDPAKLPHARAAFAKVRGGLGRAKVLAIGDSLTAGVGAGGKQFSYPSIVSNILTARGLPAYATARIGSNNTTPPYDPNTTVGTGWTNGPAGIGPAYAQVSTTGSALSQAFTTTVNQCDVWYVDSGGATFTADIDGSGTQTITPANTQNVVKYTFASLTPGTHTVNVIRTSGSGSVYIVAIDCYNTASPAVAIWNGGWSGSTSSQWTDTSHNYAIINAIKALAPDLCIYDIGTNEETGASNITGEVINYQAVVNACQASGDIIFFMHHDNNLNPAYQAITLAAMQQISMTNGIPLVDFYNRLGSYAQLNALGEIYQNSVHLSGAGYADEAVLIADVLLKL